MQALIDFLIRNLLALWPVARVYSWQHAFRVRNGVAAEELSPGLHWRWWFVDEVRTWPSTQQALDLATASITTTDGYSISISANMAFRVTSIRAMWLNVWNTTATLSQRAIGEIASLCARESWDSLRSDRSALERNLVDALNALAGDWGIEILQVRLTDLVITRGHRHYLDGMEKSA
jgi:regulator of protease activity HflC (stomatin/prohibitin superfamily)